MEDFIAIIVLYKIKLIESKTFLSLSAALNNSQTSIDLVVYDNSPVFNQGDEFNSYKNFNIIYIPDLLNSGVSKAYNKGVEFASQMNKKWVLLLDQDTEFPDNTLQSYLSAIKEYPEKKIFAPIMFVNESKIISPFRYMFMRGFSLKFIEPGINSFNKYSLINCGLCVNVEAFLINGGYNELIKLDFSDHDFIKRFKKSVSDKFVVIDLRVKHELSSETNNSLTSDLVRFDYYLEGAGYISSSLKEKFFLKLNATLRCVKLTLLHRNLGFLIKLFKWL
ncbi:GT2 family glycosyltransferase [Mucilaginibacter frigoritolerans]|uniref:GT2 family glycosyltransferase n=1 Tax=Mucilaginibacter frigoritolerans TaxID=652788 RepID=A0A562TL53_9SPHI|nr:glycosyltransferase [Mucilaginibacter frigoritolerans]TWI93816.1 GT2 family glycosyltransferase [Mucilaginibacter frigoritolerans]